MTDDVQAAVDAWLGRDGTDDDRTVLLARLASDPPFRRTLAAELHLIGMLQTVRAGEPRWPRLEDELAGPDADPAPADRLEDAVMRRVLAEPRRPARRWWAGLVVAGGLVAAGVLTNRGGRPAVPRPPEVKEEPGYWGAVARSRPWAGWRFDRMAGGKVPNVVPGRPALTVQGGVTADANGAAVFRPGTLDQGLMADDTWTPNRTEGYAVELWFRADADQRATLAALCDEPPGNDRHAFLAELFDRTGEFHGRPLSVRVADRWPPDSSAGTNLYGPRDYRPGRWHHLVGQRAGEWVQLVLDGERFETPVRSPSDTGPVRLLLGRLRAGDQKDSVDQIRPFIGRLADVALYDHPLTDDDILAHLAAGRQE